MGRVTRFLQASNHQPTDQAPARAATAPDRVDHDLERIITSWPTLPKHVQRTILTLVNAARAGETIHQLR